MPLIRIIGPALADPGQRIAPERLLDFVGCMLEADGQAVSVLRSLHPLFPTYKDTYAVAISDALEALALNAYFYPDAIIAWGALIESCLVYFPASSVEFDTNTT